LNSQKANLIIETILCKQRIEKEDQLALISCCRVPIWTCLFVLGSFVAIEFFVDHEPFLIYVKDFSSRQRYLPKKFLSKYNLKLEYR
jgi:hypothetical protein